MKAHFPLVLALLLGLLGGPLPAAEFRLAPALALEAEDFHVESGWKVLANGQGNYMVDIVGFNHISGERLLSADARGGEASAYRDVEVPEAGQYRLWARYEYPGFCEARFRVLVVQDGRTVLDQTMGKKDSPRYGFGDPVPKAQHDQSWGPDGLFCEVVTVPGLKKGPARVYLKSAEQPQAPGRSARRNMDLLYLTRDLDDGWRGHYAGRTKLYPILDAFRDTRGPRWEVRFTNRGDRQASFSITHAYNRIPWGASEPAVRAVGPGESSDWVGLANQDTTHFGATRFRGPAGPFDVEVRPVGGEAVRKLSGEGEVLLYLPPYPGKGEEPITPGEEIDAVLKMLAEAPPAGKKPTRPLCYGGWLPLGQDNEYGRKYAQLYAALGFRSLHQAHSGPAVLKNLKAVGVEPTRSWAASAYRNPPLASFIDRAKVDLAREEREPYLLWYDYGDEIHFSEWLGFLEQHAAEQARQAGRRIKPDQVMAGLWVAWLREHRSKERVTDYWRKDWGPFNLARLRPDSSAAAAVENPKLYVDSLRFYEETAIRFVAEGAREVRKALGEHVLCGGNYSCHPFYYPSTTMYVKWFRGGAAEMGRHSEYVWQVGQAGPMVNGYVAEHFRCGMRHNPRAVLRQYTMPHSPGNTEGNFLRSCFTHLAHGAKALDFFGVGMNETFTENHIDHRDHSRYRALRDVTHAVGLVEDLLPEARAVPSPVALLVSDSTERWDLAGIAADRAGHEPFGPDFRKTRLHYHLERLGLWTALTFQGASPDLLIEEDVKAEGLAGYRVLVLVGDCLPPRLAPVIEAWVRDGGVVLATAGAGRFDAYRNPSPAFARLFGLEGRETDERSTFLRPRQELPFLTPPDEVVGEGWKMPQLATVERLRPGEGVEVKAKFAGTGGPAVLVRRVGKGAVYYVGALPGLAYLWKALQPPLVPDRGPNTHTIPTEFDEGARALLAGVLRAGGVEPTVRAEPALIDARLWKAPGGAVLPIANYHARVGQKVTLTVRAGGPVKAVTSAYHGKLPFAEKEGAVVVTIPALGYGDVLRLEIRQ